MRELRRLLRHGGDPGGVGRADGIDADAACKIDIGAPLSVEKRGVCPVIERALKAAVSLHDVFFLKGADLGKSHIYQLFL